MVDVSAKPATARRAVAGGHITMSPAAFASVRDAQLAKGDVIGTARIAGVMAAKRTAELIPLCHPLALSDVQVRFALDETLPGVRCEAEAPERSRPSSVTLPLVALSCPEIRLK